MKNIGIIGCGWLGLHLAKHLITGNKIYTTTTSSEKKEQLEILGFEAEVRIFPDHETTQDSIPWQVLKYLDVIIITVPFSKNTDKQLLENRFRNIAHFINRYKKQLFLMSSIGIYPQLEMEIKENTLPDADLEPNLLGVENLIRGYFSKVNILRLGGLMGDDRMLSNYKVQMPQQIVNHIHFRDICLVIEQMIIREFTGKTYNLVAPLHPTKQEVINYQKGISGDSAVSSQLQGRKIMTDVLQQELHYEFTYPDPRKFM